MGKRKSIQAGQGDTMVTLVPPVIVERPPGDVAVPSLARSRFCLRLFFALLAVACVALIAVDSKWHNIAWLRAVFLVGLVVFGSVALMPAPKLEDAFLRPPPGNG